MSFIVGDSVAMGKPIIGVSINYRLNAFGFLNGPDMVKAGLANLGLRDQRLALHWIQVISVNAWHGAFHPEHH